jgi:hypothetical protein
MEVESGQGKQIIVFFLTGRNKASKWEPAQSAGEHL